MAAPRSDNEAEDERLDEADDQIAEFQGVDRACPELGGGNVEGEFCNSESTEKTAADAERCEDRQHQDGGDETRRHQFAYGVDAEGADRVDLIGDDHGA